MQIYFEGLFISPVYDFIILQDVRCEPMIANMPYHDKISMIAMTEAMTPYLDSIFEYPMTA